MSHESQQVKITLPDKIARLLDKVAESDLPLILRANDSPKVAVKGRACLQAKGSASGTFKIGKISAEGLKFLMANGRNGIQVEFSLVSSKVSFATTVTVFDRDFVMTRLPSELVSIERRAATRYPVGGNHRAFLEIRNLDFPVLDVAAPPVFMPTKDLNSYLPVGDVSVGGISIVTRFPAICRILDKDQIITEAKIHFPLSEPVVVNASIRWVKRLKEQVVEINDKPRTIRIYKFGVQIMEPSESTMSHFQSFIHKLNQLNAI